MRRRCPARRFAGALVLLAVGATTAAAEPRAGGLDLRRPVVVGEGLAAGLSDFGLREASQRESFAVLTLRALGADPGLPLVPSPGLGSAPGLPALPAIVPALGQARAVVPTSGRISQLAIPGITVADVVARRASEPRVDRDDPEATLANLILSAAADGAADATVLEIAASRRPTFALVCLGYSEVLEAALGADPGRLPDVSRWQVDYGRVLAGLAAPDATVVVTTVPDPFDTAAFTDIEGAARLVRAEPALVQQLFSLDAGDRLTPTGLMSMGASLIEGRGGLLGPGAVVGAEVALAVRRRVDELNHAIRTLARRHGALVFDLHALLRRARQQGLIVGGRRLEADYLGGFYLLNGAYPGLTGHAVIADELLALLAAQAGAPAASVDPAAVLASDPTARARSALGPLRRRADLAAGPPPVPPPPPPPAMDPTVPGFVPASTGEGCSPPPGVPACGLPPRAARAAPIELPEDRRVVLDLDPRSSYYGDALRAVDCPDDRPLPGFEAFPAFGSCHDTMFGGLILGDVAVHGKVRLSFEEPSDGRVRFTIDHPGGLRGDSGRLAAPQLFVLPLLHSHLRDAPGAVSSGELDLRTGEVRFLEYYTTIFNTALVALKYANPGLPFRPLGFPGPAGSVTARFDQGPDGGLDFTLFATQFLPLGTELDGAEVRLPLPLCSADLQCASIVARGTSLHPVLHFSTRAPEVEARGEPPELEENSVHELVTLLPATRFGDVFDLDVPELGGPATGETGLLGRLLVQLGPRFGHRVPVAVATLPPGGRGEPLPDLVARLPAGTTAGLVGFDSTLEFPAASYDLRRLRMTTDPWNLALGMVDTRTGRLVGDFLHRGLVVQDLIFRLFQAEPCTPKTSFCYQGPAAFEAVPPGGLGFRFEGQVQVPYPAGYRFPAPEPGETFEVRKSSMLEPFLAFTARHSPPAVAGRMAGELHGEAGPGREFTVVYDVRCGDGPAPGFRFEYRDSSAHGVFHGDELTWLDCATTAESVGNGSRPDTLTFAATGVWRRGDDSRPGTVTGQLRFTEEGIFTALVFDGGDTLDFATLAAPAERSAAAER